MSRWLWALLYMCWGVCLMATIRLIWRNQMFRKHLEMSRRFQLAALDALNAREFGKYDYEMREARRELDEARRYV